MAPSPGWSPPPAVVDGVARAWLLAATVVALWVWPDYGVTWDEQWHMEYGDHILAWLQTGGRDRSALSYRRDFYYGGAYDLLGALMRRGSDLRPFEAMHRLGAVVGVVGLVGTWKLARNLGGAWVGLLAVTSLTVTGAWWGHMFNNPKDLPFAVGYVWALVAVSSWLRQWPRPGAGAWIGVGVALGAAASVRIGGVVLWCLFVALVGAGLVVRGWRCGNWSAVATIAPRRVAQLGATLVGAWAVMIAAWPWAQQDPLRRPAMALAKMSRFDLHERTMLFAGEAMQTTEPRWDYLAHYFGLKLPVFVLALVVVAAVVALWQLPSSHRALRDPSQWGWWAVVAATVLPPLYAVARGSVLYDGLRHFLFIVPGLCVLGAWGARQLVLRLRAPLPILAYGIAVGLAALTMRQTWILVDLHPHQYVFFNRLAGGVAGAVTRYDTDYYGNTYKEAFDRLFETVWQAERVRYLDTIYVVSACAPRRVVELYLPPSFRLRHRGRTDDPPDFYLGYTREGCADKHRNAPLLARVARRGATLAVVRDLRPLYPKRKGGGQ